MAVNEINITLAGHGSGTPSTKNMKQYLTQRYNQKMSNGIDKGILCVRRLKKMTDIKRIELHDTYKIILGRNNYNQSLRDYVFNKYKDGEYYSDCSSSYIASLKLIGFKFDWLLNTVGILESDQFEDVPVKISKGHVTNPEVLKVGDAVLFKGNSSRPESNYCGHIEFVYEIDDPDKKEQDKKEQKTDVLIQETGLISSQDIVNKPYIGFVTASKLNVRKGPGTSYKAIKTISKGTYVYIAKEDGEWGYIGDGWVSLKYIDYKGLSIKGESTASYLNVRKTYPDGTVKKVIPKGTAVKIDKISEDGKWGHDTKAKGWVSLKYIKF